MTQLNLPSTTIKRIVDDPTLLHAYVLNGTSVTLDSLGMSSSAATHILHGYNSGFRAVFIMNATMAAIATVVSVLMIRHKNLERDDEAQLRAQAEKEAREDKKDTVGDEHTDIELGTLHENNDDLVVDTKE